jgi:branched-chain amino acid transport system substrate-binding protein
MDHGSTHALRLTRGFAIAAGAVLLAVGCGNSGNSNSAAKPDFVVGMIGTTSGPNAAVGVPHVDGAQAYFDQLNKSGGVNGRKIKFVAMDDKGSADTALADLRDLQSQGALVVNGPAFANQLVSAAPLCAQLKVTCLSGGVPRTLLLPPQPYIYSNDILPAAESYMQLDFFASKGVPANAKIGFIGVQTANGQDGEAAMRDAIKQHSGWSLVFDQLLPTSATDVAPVISKLRDAKPDAVALATTEPVAILVMNQMSDLGLNVPVVNYHGGSGVTNVKTINNPNYYVMKEFVPTSVDSPNMEKLLAAAAADGFSDAANASFGFTEYYVSAALVAEALKRCAGNCTSGADFNNAMEKISLDIPGVLWGPIAYSPTKHQGVTTDRIFHLDTKGGNFVQANSQSYQKTF